MSDGRVLKVSYRGTGLADRNQAVPVHFEIDGEATMLRAGQLLTVLAQTETERKGIAVPRTAVVPQQQWPVHRLRPYQCRELPAAGSAR